MNRTKNRNLSSMFITTLCLVLFSSCDTEDENAPEQKQQNYGILKPQIKSVIDQFETPKITDELDSDKPNTESETSGQSTQDQSKPFELDEKDKKEIDNIKKDCVGFKNYDDPKASKQTIIGALNKVTGLADDEKIQHEDITTLINLGNGSSFCTINKAVTMFNYNCNGFMNAGNTEGKDGGGLAGVFCGKFGSDKIFEALGKKGVAEGECRCVKINWMSDHTKDKDLLYAVGVSGAKTDRLISLRENLFYITIDYLRHKYFGGQGAHLTMEQIRAILGDNFDSFEKQVSCNYKTIILAAESAKTNNINPYLLGMNPISTSIWGFDPSAAAYINLAIMYFLTSITSECQNVCIIMWCYGIINNGDSKDKTEDTPYKNIIPILQKD